MTIRKLVTLAALLSLAAGGTAFAQNTQGGGAAGQGSTATSPSDQTTKPANKSHKKKHSKKSGGSSTGAASGSSTGAAGASSGAGAAGGSTQK